MLYYTYDTYTSKMELSPDHPGLTGLSRTELDLVPLVTTALASALQVEEAKLRNVAPGRIETSPAWVILHV